ncbi:MAG: protein O-mannosyl-transferase family [Betaproteobacteria bacterium]
MRLRRSLAALAVVAVAFPLYRATLLPGFDFGDTGSFQTAAGEPTITPRDGYPLYFALGDVFVWTLGGDHAHALNLASAVEGALACGLLALAGAALSGSAAAGAAAALLFAGSYTFWSQSIIAEVYSLHILLLSLTLLLLLAWQRRPTMGRLAWFFAAYALGFGNHLSMILLAPACTAFLLVSAPRGWRSMFAPRVVALAVALATLGAMQYLWNLRELWLWPNQPHGIVDALETFWFDVTKTDWRATTVLHVPASMLGDRAAMYWFDLRQQFGWGWLLAPVGLVRLWTTDWRRALLLALMYVVNFAFAFGYNVGDTHVFYLPSHAVVALLCAPGIAWIGDAAAVRARDRRMAVTAAAVLAAYAGFRMYDDYPALDRSRDTRPTEVLSRLTAGLDPIHDVLLEDLNWQLQNGLSYFGKEVHPELVYARLPDVLLYAPALVRDNLRAGRDVVVSPRAREALAAAYGPLLPTEPDPRVQAPTADRLVSGLSAGTRYVLCVLKPTREFRLDRADVESALRRLAGSPVALPAEDYVAVAGVTGRMPSLVRGSSRPFRARLALEGLPVDIRMESWLSMDTIRRMGFAQVVAARRHALIAERGVSFVAVDAEGRPMRSGYEAGIFARQPRYLIARAIVASWMRSHE